MSDQELAGLNPNDSGTGEKIDTPLTHACSPDVHALRQLSRDLSRRRPKLPPDARPHCSNLIEQIDQIETAEDLERVRPFMVRSAAMLEALS